MVVLQHKLWPEHRQRNFQFPLGRNRIHQAVQRGVAVRPQLRPLPLAIADSHCDEPCGRACVVVRLRPNSAEPNDIFHWNFVWEVPVGRGRQFAGHMNRLADGVLGGWLLSGLGTWQTGVPLTVTANSGTTASGATANRADRVGSGSLDTPTPQRWFDVTAYKLQLFIDASLARPVRQFGTTGVGTVYGPRLFSFDMTLQYLWHEATGEQLG